MLVLNNSGGCSIGRDQLSVFIDVVKSSLCNIGTDQSSVLDHSCSIRVGSVGLMNY